MHGVEAEQAEAWQTILAVVKMGCLCKKKMAHMVQSNTRMDLRWDSVRLR